MKIINTYLAKFLLTDNPKDHNWMWGVDDQYISDFKIYWYSWFLIIPYMIWFIISGCFILLFKKGRNNESKN